MELGILSFIQLGAGVIAASSDPMTVARGKSLARSLSSKKRGHR
jgi:hypothetical protein